MGGKGGKRKRQARFGEYRVEAAFPLDLEQYMKWRVDTGEDETTQGVVRRAVRRLMEAEPQKKGAVR